jgi:hypothetical protein
MATTTGNALDRFVKKTRELFARESGEEARWEAMAPILAEMLAEPDVVRASKAWPYCTFAEGRPENFLFYEDPDFGFVVNGLVVVGDGAYGVRIHDHGPIYTLYGVLDGDQVIERYERVDDRSRAEHAEIRQTRGSRCGPGEIDLVLPYEIHAERPVGERTVAVIVRTKRNDDFKSGRYDPTTNRYSESLGPRQTPIDLFTAAPRA